MSDITGRLPELSQPERPDPSKPGMVWIAGGTFLMGSEHHHSEEAPVRRVQVSGFWMDRYPVTNAQFRKFSAATGHLTIAEVAPDPRDYPGALPQMLEPHALVFVAPDRPVDLHDVRNWWVHMRGADWRHPHGPDSSIRGLDDHPVVNVAYRDAQAYAVWAGKMLPTEAQWEFAARGGLECAEFPWGDEAMPGGRYMANVWHGQFPWQNLASDGYQRTSPVGAFPPNGYGLFDMVGNVWEWTADWYQPHHFAAKQEGCGIPVDPRGGLRKESFDPRQSRVRIPRKVLKGGSHLCAPDHGYGYRPAARYAQPVDTSACHVGFRCIIRGEGP
jgi:formylglycine-generating enzyme required for sulfatase activity